MSSWKYKVEIGDLHDRYSVGLLDIKQLSEEVIIRFKTLSCYNYKEDCLDFDHGFDYKMSKLVDEFDELVKFGTLITVEDYDAFLEKMYNWGDRNKTCWINTF